MYRTIPSWYLTLITNKTIPLLDISHSEHTEHLPHFDKSHRSRTEIYLFYFSHKSRTIKYNLFMISHIKPNYLLSWYPTKSRIELSLFLISHINHVPNYLPFGKWPPDLLRFGRIPLCSCDSKERYPASQIERLFWETSLLGKKKILHLYKTLFTRKPFTKTQHAYLASFIIENLSCLRF